MAHPALHHITFPRAPPRAANRLRLPRRRRKRHTRKLLPSSPRLQLEAPHVNSRAKPHQRGEARWRILHPLPRPRKRNTKHARAGVQIQQKRFASANRKFHESVQTLCQHAQRAGTRASLGIGGATLAERARPAWREASRQTVATAKRVAQAQPLFSARLGGRRVEQPRRGGRHGEAWQFWGGTSPRMAAKTATKQRHASTALGQFGTRTSSTRKQPTTSDSAIGTNLGHSGGNLKNFEILENSIFTLKINDLH